MRYALLSVVLLSACVAMPEPVVSAYNGSTVSIQGPGLAPPSAPGADDIALASATCGGKATYASGRMVGDAWVERLFICG
jgi:hypothetical protein